MQELRLVAVSEDGTYLVLATAGRGTRFTLPVDDRLRAAVRGHFSRLGQFEIEVESPLRPKEIQARIRAGETAEEIAESAGIPVERVRWFEGPVLQEREYMAQQAQRVTVRRPGEASPGPPLGEVVQERLGRGGVDLEDVEWDSWKCEDSTWRIRLSFFDDGRPHAAEWVFDPRRRHVSPLDEVAARLASMDWDGPATDRVTPLVPRRPAIKVVPDSTSPGAGGLGPAGEAGATGFGQAGSAGADQARATGIGQAGGAGYGPAGAGAGGFGQAGSAGADPARSGGIGSAGAGAGAAGSTGSDRARAAGFGSAGAGAAESSGGGPAAGGAGIAARGPGGGESSLSDEQRHEHGVERGRPLEARPQPAPSGEIAASDRFASPQERDTSQDGRLAAEETGLRQAETTHAAQHDGARVEHERTPAAGQVRAIGGEGGSAETSGQGLPAEPAIEPRERTATGSNHTVTPLTEEKRPADTPGAPSAEPSAPANAEPTPAADRTARPGRTTGRPEPSTDYEATTPADEPATPKHAPAEPAADAGSTAPARRTAGRSGEATPSRTGTRPAAKRRTGADRQPEKVAAKPAAPAEKPATQPAAAAETAPRQPARTNRRKSKGKRASVPSWDEIMFGARRPE